MLGMTGKHIGRILISNDDGVDAIGISILQEIAATLSDDIWTIAPSNNRSGASRSITLRQDVVIEETAPKTYICSGTPSDCIIFGMTQILNQQPDLVLTGVNNGMNVADDVLYSGTVAGAMEASLLGVPAIALSQQHSRDEPIDYTASRLFGEEVIRHILEIGVPKRTVMNVNFPKTHPNKIRGMTATHLDRHKLGDVIVKGQAPNHYRLGPLHSSPETSEGSDRAALDNGWISLTPLMMDLTSHHILDQIPVLNFLGVKQA